MARCRHRLAVDPDRIVDAAHDEVARRRPTDGHPDGRKLLEHLLGLERSGAGRARGADPIDHVACRDAWRATAEVLVLTDDDLVERARRNRAVLDLVLIAPVARDPDHPDRPSAPRVTVRRRPDPPGL